MFMRHIWFWKRHYHGRYVSRSFLCDTSDVGRLVPQPWWWADIVYQWCSPIRFRILHSNLSARPTCLHLSTPLRTWAISCCQKILSESSQHSCDHSRETQSMANGGIHCRAPQYCCAACDLLAGWKHLCFHNTPNYVCLQLWNGSLHFRPIWAV